MGVYFPFGDPNAFTSTPIGVSTQFTGTLGGGGSLGINTQSGSGAYTLVASDAGKAIIRTAGTVTITNNVFSGGDMVTIINGSGSDMTLTATIDALYNTADGATGSRTLASRGSTTILFTAHNIGYISGSGLT